MQGIEQLLPTKVQLDQAQKIVRALCHPLRMKLLAFIDENPNCYTKQTYEYLKVEQSIASLNLTILAEAGLISKSSHGRFSRLHVNYEQVKAANDAILRFLAKKQHK